MGRPGDGDAVKQYDQQRLEQRAHSEYAEAKARLNSRAIALQVEEQELEVCHAARLDAIRWMAEGTATDANGPQPDSPRACIRAAVEECDDLFTRMDLASKLAKQNGSTPSRGVVVDELHALVNEGYLRVVRKGRGRRPTKYEKFVEERHQQ